MIKTMYHATRMENLDSILEQGILPSRIDGIVYLTETPEDAAKFLLIRLVDPILVLKINVEETDLIETFDHSEVFFKCRCFGCTKPIPPEDIEDFLKFSKNS